MGAIAGTLTLIIGFILVIISTILPAYYTGIESLIVTILGIMMILLAFVLYMRDES